jgi:hypothetical protein
MTVEHAREVRADARSPRGDGLGSGGDVALSASTLGALLRAYGERGAAPPVAVVFSVLDDLLELGPDGHGRRRVEPDDVLIDVWGRAHAEARLSLDGLCPLIARALGRVEADDEAVPGPARALLSRLVSDDPDERPADAEQLRQWLREALGAPAPREEVLACVQDATGAHAHPAPAPAAAEAGALAQQIVAAVALAPPAPHKAPSRGGLAALSGLETILPEPSMMPEPASALPVPEPVEDVSELPTLPPGLRAFDGEPDAVESEPPLAPPSMLLADERPFAEPLLERTALPRFASSDSRAVVRHVLSSPSDPRVSVTEAPAARRSARPAVEGPDSLLLPPQRSGGLAWVAVAAVISATIYFLFFT